MAVAVAIIGSKFIVPASLSPPPLLEVRDLACVRGGRPLFRALSFTVQEGELLWVEGRNGAGKTSLLRLVCGLAEPDGGEVRWRGAPARAQREGFLGELLYLGHLNALKDDLSVMENLRLAACLAGADASRADVEAALAAAGIGALGARAVRALSQGQRRRAALARLWLPGTRPLWILDEPFSALDAEAVQRLAARIAAHLQGGGVALLTTHQEVTLPGARVRRLALH
jgi:heme exporter protein A